MSNLFVEHYFLSLARLANFRLILPDKLPPQMTAGNPHYGRPAKTLFLLHGYSGSSTDWLYNTAAPYLATKYNLALVFPDGDVSFYVDGAATGRAYGTYVGQELPAFLRETFGLSMKPEDTMIGGNSMGGFGALHTALAHPEVFGGAFGLSSALIIHTDATSIKDDEASGVMANRAYYESCFGDLTKVEQSDHNPEVLVKKLKAAGTPIPKMYMACGTEDFLLEQNRAFHEFLVSEQVPVKYEESPGVHDWDFWNRFFEPALKYLLDCE